MDQTQIVEDGISSLSKLDFEIGRVLALNPRPREGLFGFTGSDVEGPLHLICSLQAQAYGCLFDRGNRSMESNKNRTARLERVNEFRERIGDLEIPTLSDRGIRNAMAHYDEYYLNSIRKRPNSGFAQWLGVSHRAALGNDPICIGVYFYNEDEMHLFDRVTKLVEMRKEIELVISALGMEFDQTSRPDHPDYREMAR